MDAQHRHQRKERPARLAFGLVRRNEFDQRSPENHMLHLFQEHLLAGFLRAEMEIQGGLLHGLYFLRRGLRQGHNRGRLTAFP